MIVNERIDPSGTVITLKRNSSITTVTFMKPVKIEKQKLKSVVIFDAISLANARR